MSHSPRHYRNLEKLMVDVKSYKIDVYEEYVKTLMEGLRLIATVKKQVNVLRRIMGYLNRYLTTDEKQEVQEVIHNFYQQRVPLTTPITLLTHYIRKYGISHLERQHYLYPHHVELMLRNHI